ncbi:MAG: cytidine deaminase [Candidatus Kapabacteria bacterium]|nr:cytidine deaminase [Candidatus Kapabacteria bacterium]
MKRELDQKIIEEAVAAALAARTHAYAPYSDFLVGAAVVDTDGGVHVGCNVENASYGLTNCAERAAVAAATVAGKRDLDLCVVVTDGKSAASPCGACRQVLHECSPNMLILCTTPDRNDVWFSLNDLLPNAFGPKSL